MTKAQKVFLEDCVARALATLPYATLNPEDFRDDRVQKMQDVVRKPTREGIAFLYETLQSEVSTHEMCGNGIKADVIDEFTAGVMHFLTGRGTL